ncbi:MAG: HAD family hydrolase [Planctomycetia bacterium]
MYTPRGRPLAGVVFDMDGTLVDSRLDFNAIRTAMGFATDAGPILELLDALPPAERESRRELLHQFENDGADRATVFAGVAEWLDFLDARRIPRAVLTRNSRAVVERTFRRCGLAFETVYAREDAKPKPDPDGVMRIAAEWSVEPAALLVVGDYLHDVEAGGRAGAVTALISYGVEPKFRHEADHVWPDLLHGLAEARGWFPPSDRSDLAAAAE